MSFSPGFVPVSPGSFHPSGSAKKDAAGIANTQLDWKEASDEHIFKADLPGVKKEEIKIEVKVEAEDDRFLIISGERKKEEEKETDKWHQMERSYGKFLRSFHLPENANVDQVKATMENGVLTVTVAKQPNPIPGVRAIEISVKLNANKVVVGTLQGFDQFMNLVLDGTVEVNGNERNEIGMVVLRGNSVVMIEALEPVNRS